MSALLPVVAFVYLSISALRGFVNLANLRHGLAQGVPQEFRGIVSEEKYRQSQEYLAAQTRFSLVSRIFSSAAAVAFLLGGGFAAVDQLAGSWASGPVPHALLYFLVLGALDQILDLPFSWYHTFVLEQRFGFNRSSVGTFVGDLLKGWALGLILGGLLAAAVIWFFVHGGALAWLWAWGFFTLFSLLLTFLAPAVLMPLFNKFEPLPAGELRSAIESYAARVGFRLQGIFTMDGSKRSSKANAFFVGFGRFRRIVLFDTLVQQQTVQELVAVLAHEVGHFKRHHIPKQIGLSLATSFLMFWIFSLILGSPELARSFGFPEPSVHAAVTIAFWLYAPFSLLTGLLTHSLSRRFEFEADAFARETTKDPLSLVSALKKLSVDSLSNLNPHPWKVMLDYTHPPVTQRLRELLR